MRFGKLKNKGAAIILVAGITLSFLLLFFVVAIDFSRMYYVRGELQNAADAGALAGAKLLNAVGGTTQESARAEAQKFAGLNKAAGQFVQTELNTGNNTSGDIVVGNWDATLSPKFDETRTPVNAVKVVARRTFAAPVGGISVGSNPVDLLFGKLISGLTNMAVVREAIAARKPLAVPGVPLCVESCDLNPMPVNLLIHETLGPSCSYPTCLNNANGMAFTAFSSAQAPNVGPSGDVVDYIWGRRSLPTTLCELCITTNNTGGGRQALSALKDAFSDKAYKRADKTFDSDGNVISWLVAVPLVDRTCSSTVPDPCSACPPGCQGISETYHVEEIAVIDIIAVTDTGPSSGRGITIDSINCTGCPTSLPLGNDVGLVK
jgi:Flp pilus assembly protein TadG